MFGSNIKNARNTTKTPYLPVSRKRLRKRNAYMNTPQPMLELIGQPLWRKNDERLAEALRGIVSALANDMRQFSDLFRISTFGFEFGSGKRLKKFQQHILAALE